MIESGRVPGKGRIRASIQKLFPRVPENCRIYESTEKRYNTGEYGEKVESVRLSKNCSHEYRKIVESMRVRKNRRIRASTGKRYNPCE